MNDESCDKIRYVSQGSANKDLKRIKRAKNRGVKPIRSYLCDLCNRWHLTSKKRDRESINKKKYIRNK